MKTNLIFKRQITIDGISKVEVKIVPVEVDGINSNEGWILNGHADIITQELTSKTIKEDPKKEPLKFGSKFQSNVSGTAKLVRVGDTIKIVARKGKKTLNETTPNSVCISDATKNNFFNDFRHHRESIGDEYCFKSPTKYFSIWNTYMDVEYNRQLDEYNKN